jgi:hypothetical protein
MRSRSNRSAAAGRRPWYEQGTKLDLRLDDQRLNLFTVAANRNARPGTGTAPDAHLKIRLPVKAGTREIAATFLKDSVVQEGIIDRVREDQVRTYFEGVGTITIAGPYSDDQGQRRAARRFSPAVLPRAPTSRPARTRSSRLSLTVPIGGR